MAWRVCQGRHRYIPNRVGLARNPSSVGAAGAYHGIGWTLQHIPYLLRQSPRLQLQLAVAANDRRKATAMAAATAMCTALETEVILLTPVEFSCGTTGQLSHHPSIARAAAVLAAGEVVAIPTETVYGLAANALSASAVGRVYAAKNRPADNPLIVHVSSLDMLTSLYPSGWSLPPVYEAVVRDLWPGPLTILLPRSSLVPEVVTCGQLTMAVRMPAHPVALALIAACGFPLAAPSANSSGRPSPTLARHVVADLGGRVPLILDGGACTCGVESTVLDGLRNPPAILRPGSVTREQLAGYPGLEGLQLYRRDFVDPQLEAAPSTPGMKYRHYSPSAPLVLLDPGAAQVASVSDEVLSARLQRRTESLLAELRAVRREADADGSSNDSIGGGPQAGMAEPQQLKGRGANLGSKSHEASTAGKLGLLVGVLRTSLLGVRTGPLLHRHCATGTSSPSSSPPGPCTVADGGSAQVASNSEQRPSGPRADLSSSEANGLIGQDSEAEDSRGRHPQPGPVSSVNPNSLPAAEPQPPYEYVLGHISRPAEVASELFAALRHMDEMGMAVIVVEGVRDAGAGVAVMNRLRKAASRVVVV